MLELLPDSPALVMTRSPVGTRTQILRTTFRADGTPLGKTLTIQGGSTPVVLRRDPKDLDPDE
ncbi:hypothetical protein [Streptacidiphilus sp. PAMC 29251]